ncbi:MAG: hypothetical protein HY282_03205 [Nitrospirae bacterium]|nr:hypothetical protein [Candidatus Manganitrophaceae bacterium]
MYEGFLEYGLPILIVLTFVNFIWAWVLTAVKAPERSEEKRRAGEAGADRPYLEEGRSGGTRKSIAEKVYPKTKTV